MENESKRNIQSIERAVTVLDYLMKKPHGEHLTTISRELGLNKSTAFSIISTLENLRCVTQNQDNGRYMLGLRLLEFAQSLLLNLDIVNIAKPYLRDLASQYDETINLALLSGNDVIYVDRVQSSKSIRVEMRLNEKVPVYCCSTGKIFLAFMEEEQRKRILDKTTFQPRTIYSISNRAQLEADLDIIRQRGYAYDREEYEIGLTCIASPIRNRHGETIASISLNAPTNRMLNLGQETLIKDMTSVTDKLTQKLESLGV